MRMLRQIASEARRRTLFRVYLGYARGVGATTAMLDEGRRRRGRGTDVVVASYRVHGDADNALRDLDVLASERQQPEHKPLDVEAVLARNPDVVCIDDLAELDEVGLPRLAGVSRLLAAGITVLATVHLLSVRSIADAYAAMLGGTSSGGLIDDSVLESIDELELVDMTPEDLLERMREQAVLRPAELAMAMQRELRITVLESLRESAFRLIADHADRQLVGFMRESGVIEPWDVRGRIIVALPARQGLEDRIRRSAAYAAMQDAKFSVVSVRTRSMTDEQKEWMGAYAALTHQLGGEFVHLHGESVARALVDYVHQSLATEVILGHRRRNRWRPGDTTSQVIRRLSGVDVHVLRADP
jgi:two-component system sensor histidine kinase KdpD